MSSLNNLFGFSAGPAPASPRSELPTPVRLSLELVELTKFRMCAQSQPDGNVQLTPAEEALLSAACETIRHYITGENLYLDESSDAVVQVSKRQLIEAVNIADGGGFGENAQLQRLRSLLRSWLMV